MWSNVATPKIGPKLDSPKTNANPDNQKDLLFDNKTNQQQHQHDQKPSGSPLMRYKHAVCSSPTSGFIYIHGGRFGNLPLDDDVWRFDPHQNSWLQLETTGSKPPSLQEHTLVEYNEQLFLFGGQVSASNQENSFWRLDLANNQWHSLDMKSSKKFGTYLGPTNRRGHSAVIYKDSMYIFGGYEDFRGSSAQLWQYDLLNQRWQLSNLGSMSACHPEPRHSHSAIVYEDSMYIYGGLSNLKPLSDLWRWSWREKRWFKERTRGHSPGQLHGHTAIQAFGSMFVFGGERRGRTTRSLWRLNLSNLSWQKVRPKGPRPNPTTWHGAIANPLSILDEANYIIEGGCQLLAQTNANSLSDSCFLIVNGDHQSAQLDQPIQSSVDHERSRPVNQNENDITNMKPPHCKSSSSIATKSCPVAGKKRLRLSFLRKSIKASRATLSSSSSSYELKQMPSSLSAANLVGIRSNQQDLATKRHSIAITETPMRNVATSKETYEGHSKVNGDEQETNVKILDNLDSDIKQMFERALSPDKEAQEKMWIDDYADNTNSRSQGNGGPMRDSMTNSQLSCWTQTYQTARDQLASNSTATITNELNVRSQHASFAYTTPPNEPALRLPVELAPATGSQDKSDQDARVKANTISWRDNRPKSEIVQSLIDRADARIKHLYTPFFNPNSSRSNQFNANDPILGKLQNHRMFERSSSRERNQQQRNANHHHRFSLDKSKRHTIHQTMTYYNLYFSEDKNGPMSPIPNVTGDNETDNESIKTNDANFHLHADDQPLSRLVRDDLSSSTIKGALSTSAALVGVRDGNSSSGSQMDPLSISLVDTGQNSSESRTICVGAGSMGPHSDQTQNELNMTNETQTGQKSHSLQHALTRRDTTSESGDNTSLSFSVIAEFEEDDMLQYSSPTDPVITVAHHNNRRDDNERDDHHLMQTDEPVSRDAELNKYGPVPMVQQDSVTSRQAFEQAAHKSASSGYDSIHSSYEHNSSLSQINRCPPGLQGNQLAGDQNTPSFSRNNDSHQVTSDTHEDTGSSLGELSPSRADQHQQHYKRRRPILYSSSTKDQEDNLKTIATTTSSTTADSLALTTTSDAFESSISPSYRGHSHQALPSKSLPSSPPEKKHIIGDGVAICDLSSSQQNRKQAANQRHRVPFVSRSARFFSKKKSKTRYWQLCMFVIGGKQGGAHGMNDPITIWRLYI